MNFFERYGIGEACKKIPSRFKTVQQITIMRHNFDIFINDDRMLSR
jgi:hypothetical protein